MNLDKPLDDLLCKVDKLDDMFECPVCFERLSENIPQCIQGHHLCRECRSLVSQCPVCKRNFNDTRNYLVENMIPKVEEIKYSLVNLSINKNTLQIANEKKTGLSVIGEGKFLCAVKDCNKPLSFVDMIPHIKKVHDVEYFNDVGPVQSNMYSDSYSVVHKCSSSCHEIYYIHNMGIFFVKIDISQKGNVYGHVEIANSNSNAQYFYYILEMGEDEDGKVKVFQGQVVSTNGIHKKSKYLDISDLLQPIYNGGLWFICNVKIIRLR